MEREKVLILPEGLAANPSTLHFLILGSCKVPPLFISTSWYLVASHLLFFCFFFEPSRPFWGQKVITSSVLCCLSVPKEILQENKKTFIKHITSPTILVPCVSKQSTWKKNADLLRASLAMWGLAWATLLSPALLRELMGALCSGQGPWPVISSVTLSHTPVSNHFTVLRL